MRQPWEVIAEHFSARSWTRHTTRASNSHLRTSSRRNTAPVGRPSVAPYGNSSSGG
jgi:hypothetical protein